MVCLCLARFLVAFVSFGRWRQSLGTPVSPNAAVEPLSGEDLQRARRLAGLVERGAARLPIATKCLPRAMALTWLLIRSGLPSRLKIAVRPPSVRAVSNDLHAWVEVGGETVIGELPGPWVVTLALESGA